MKSTGVPHVLQHLSTRVNTLDWKLKLFSAPNLDHNHHTITCVHKRSGFQFNSPTTTRPTSKRFLLWIQFTREFSGKSLKWTHESQRPNFVQSKIETLTITAHQNPTKKYKPKWSTVHVNENQQTKMKFWRHKNRIKEKKNLPLRASAMEKSRVFSPNRFEGSNEGSGALWLACSAD